MTLRKASGRPDVNQHATRGPGQNSPARDISWHPYFPVIASTEFNGNINLWTMQNIKQEDQQKIKQQEEAEKKKA